MKWPEKGWCTVKQNNQPYQEHFSTFLTATNQSTKNINTIIDKYKKV